MKITEAALNKIESLNHKREALRIGVIGGGCSGFQYLMEFTSEAKQMLDQALKYPEHALIVLIDSTSAMYLNDAELDYVSSLQESGFKFTNPNVSSRCGCGRSFGV